MNQISPYAWPGMYNMHPLAKVVRTKYTPKIIMDAVCIYYEITPAILKNGGRQRMYVKARYVSWLLMKELVERITLKEMGKHLGGFDHTSVIHGLRQLENRHAYPELELELQAIKELTRQLAHTPPK